MPKSLDCIAVNRSILRINPLLEATIKASSFIGSGAREYSSNLDFDTTLTRSLPVDLNWLLSFEVGSLVSRYENQMDTPLHSPAATKAKTASGLHSPHFMPSGRSGNLVEATTPRSFTSSQSQTATGSA